MTTAKSDDLEKLVEHFSVLDALSRYRTNNEMERYMVENGFVKPSSGGLGYEYYYQKLVNKGYSRPIDSLPYDNRCVPENSCCLDYNRKGDSFYVKVKAKSVCDQCCCKFESLFIYPSASDEHSTDIKPKDIMKEVHELIDVYSVRRVNTVLSQIPIDNIPGIYVMLFLMLMDSPSADIISDNLQLMRCFQLFPRDIVFRLKCLGVVCRRTGFYSGLRIQREITSSELMNVVGLNLGTGRVDGRPDMVQEEINRSKGCCHIRWENNDTAQETNCEDDKAHVIIKELIDKYMTRLTRPDDGDMDISDVWATRKIGVSGGSSQMARSMLVGLGRKNVSSAKKTHLVEMIQHDPVPGWLRGDPKTIGSTSQKPEPGKERLIIGVDEQTYTICARVLSRVEPRLCLLPGVTLMEDIAVQCNEEVIWSRLTKSGECWLLSADYRDFNIQHCQHIMSYVWTSMANQYEKLFGSSRSEHQQMLIDCCRWLAEAEKNTYIKDNVQNRTYKVMVGLLSGHRSTNFMNTLLNVIYFELGIIKAESLVGCHIDVEHRAHQGDDLVIAFKRVVDSMLWIETMRGMGFELSAEKQMEGTKVMEFLKKVWIRGRVATSAPRRLVNLMNRSIEGSQFILAESAVRRVHDLVWKCYRAGLGVGVCRWLYNFLTNKAVNIHMSLPGATEKNRLSRDYLTLVLNLPPPGFACKPKKFVRRNYKVIQPIIYDIEELPSYATDDLFEYICKEASRFGLEDISESDALRFKRSLHAATYLSITDDSVKHAYILNNAEIEKKKLGDCASKKVGKNDNLMMVETTNGSVSMTGCYRSKYCRGLMFETFRYICDSMFRESESNVVIFGDMPKARKALHKVVPFMEFRDMRRVFSISYSALISLATSVVGYGHFVQKCVNKAKQWCPNDWKRICAELMFDETFISSPLIYYLSEEWASFVKAVFLNVLVENYDGRFNGYADYHDTIAEVYTSFIGWFIEMYSHSRGLAC